MMVYDEDLSNNKIYVLCYYYSVQCWYVFHYNAFLIDVEFSFCTAKWIKVNCSHLIRLQL